MTSPRKRIRDKRRGTVSGGSGTNGNITGFPYTVDLSSQGVIDAMKFVSTGAACTYASGASWSGGDAVKIYDPTVQGYSAILSQTTWSGAAADPTQINIRFVCKLTQEYMEDDTVDGPGPKWFILKRKAPDDV